MLAGIQAAIRPDRERRQLGEIIDPISQPATGFFRLIFVPPPSFALRYRTSIIRSGGRV
jgi:hypothetical protein